MSLRTEKVESVIQKSISTLISENVHFPQTTITVTRVQVSPDLKYATVWLSIFGRMSDQAASEIVAMTSEFSRKIANLSTTKFAPKLRFNFDTSAEYADNINRLIKGI